MSSQCVGRVFGRSVALLLTQLHNAVDVDTRDVKGPKSGAWVLSNQRSQNGRVGLSGLLS